MAALSIALVLSMFLVVAGTLGAALVLVMEHLRKQPEQDRQLHLYALWSVAAIVVGAVGLVVCLRLILHG